jgi:hypothetical protein
MLPKIVWYLLAIITGALRDFFTWLDKLIPTEQRIALETNREDARCRRSIQQMKDREDK